MASTGRPLSSHPAFAPLVGLWFAALLGGGLMVMPYTVHDAIAARTGLGTLVAAGSATRLAVAGAGALLGLLLGLAIARRIAGVQTGAADEDDDWGEAPMHEDSDALPPADSVWLGEAGSPVAAAEAPQRRRMFNPREELGDEGIGPAPAPEAPAEPAAISALMEEWQAAADSTPEPAPAYPEPADPAEAEWQEVDEEKAARWTPPAETPEPAEPARSPSPEPAAATPVPQASPDLAALGDLPLSDLTARLAVALARSRPAAAPAPAAAPPPQPAEPGPPAEDPDPVIAFLRREADRGGARARTGPQAGPGEDPQAVLRSALDRLSQVRGPN